MPKLFGVEASVAAKTMHGFDYTSIAVEKLGATEYTVVGIVTDKTSSVRDFKDNLEKMMSDSVGSCRSSARALNLLIRTTAFNSNGIEELHGFTLLNTIDPDAYIDTIHPGGYTNLYEATLDSIEATDEYVQGLFDAERICNANSIIFIITDGEDNDSPPDINPQAIKEAIAKVKRSEVMESIRTILIGINDTNPHFKQKLEEFRQEAALDEYLSMGDVTEKKLAKLAQFVSQSISSTSQALGTGQPSQPIDDFKF
jgi:uncharacterized protein YegL